MNVRHLIRVIQVLFKPQNVVFGLKILFPRNFLGIFRGNSEETLFFLGIPSEYSEEIPRNQCLGFQYVNFFLNGSIDGYMYQNASIDRVYQVFLGISLEYSDGIPRKKRVSSKFPRNNPRKFRGNRVFKPKTTFCRLNNTYITLIKCLTFIMKSKICSLPYN